MKKTVKLIAVVAIMLAMVMLLTGCGKKEENKKEEDTKKGGSSTIVATRTVDESGLKYEEEMNIKLKDNKVDEAQMSMTFESEEFASLMKTELEKEADVEGFKIEVEGKKLIIKMDAKTYEQTTGTKVEEVSENELREELKAQGYEVK